VTLCTKITFGSCVHQGYVNHLFDYHHSGYIGSVRKWINFIGTALDAEKIQYMKMKCLIFMLKEFVSIVPLCMVSIKMKSPNILN